MSEVPLYIVLGQIAEGGQGSNYECLQRFTMVHTFWRGAMDCMRPPTEQKYLQQLWAHERFRDASLGNCYSGDNINANSTSQKRTPLEMLPEPASIP